MATVTFIPNKAQSTSAMKGVLQYIAQEKKTENGSFVSGLNCSPQFCFQEFTATRKLHHKTSSMYFYHYVQSFHPRDPVTPEQAHEIAVASGYIRRQTKWKSQSPHRNRYKQRSRQHRYPHQKQESKSSSQKSMNLLSKPPRQNRQQSQKSNSQQPTNLYKLAIWSTFPVSAGLKAKARVR